MFLTHDVQFCLAPARSCRRTPCPAARSRRLPQKEKSPAFALDTRAVSGRVLQSRLQYGLSRRKEKALSGGREESWT